MNALMHFLQITVGPLILIFTVSSLAAMGLQVRLPEVRVALRNKKSIALIFVWGWVVGPAFAYLITMVLPLAEPYKVVILLGSLAPSAPFLAQMVGKARGDLGFAGALIPLVAVGTVVLMPLIAPLLVKGVSISALALAKPLLLTILLPLLIGAAIRYFADAAATKLHPGVKKFALIATLLTTLWCLVIYGQSMLNTAGEFALLSLVLFMVGMALMTYNLSFGLKQSQRSIMALGLSTLNGAALFTATTTIPNADPRIGAMTVMWILVSIPLAAFATRIFAKKAEKAEAGRLT
jgi:BASS family bile acid:Na+ symporter